MLREHLSKFLCIDKIISNKQITRVFLLGKFRLKMKNFPSRHRINKQIFFSHRQLQCERNDWKINKIRHCNFWKFFKNFMSDSSFSFFADVIKRFVIINHWRYCKEFCSDLQRFFFHCYLKTLFCILRRWNSCYRNILYVVTKVFVNKYFFKLFIIWRMCILGIKCVCRPTNELFCQSNLLKTINSLSERSITILL